jgi:hypothetical protein
VPGQQHQRPQAQAQPDRRRRDLHQADAGPGRLGRDQGAGPAAGRYNRLVRRFGGDKNPGAKKKAITAIAHTLLKIAYRVLKTGTPYQEPGADFYTRRESPQQRQAYLQRQLQKLHPGCTITITISPPEPPDRPALTGTAAA